MLGLFLMLICAQCEECAAKIKVAVFELSGAGTEKELRTTISDLLRLELAKCEKYKVIDKGTMLDTLGEDLVATGMKNTVERSESLNVSLAVTGHMSKLGNKIIVSVFLINRWDKEVVFADKLTATSIEDLEIVVERLADALCKMKKAQESVTIETITEEEAKPRRRRESYHTMGLMLGYLFPIGGSYGKGVEGNIWDSPKLGKYIRAMPGGSFLYFYETPYYMAEVTYRMHIRSLTSFTGIGFSGYRFLSLEDLSPYIGAGLGMSWGSRVTGIDSSYYVYSKSDTNWYYSVKTEGFDGLTMDIGGGIMFFRTYDFHFIVNLKYAIVFAEGTPNGLALSFGISYKKGGGGGSCCAF